VPCEGPAAGGSTIYVSQYSPPTRAVKEIRPGRRLSPKRAGQSPAPRPPDPAPGYVTPTLGADRRRESPGPGLMGRRET